MGAWEEKKNYSLGNENIDLNLDLISLIKSGKKNLKVILFFSLQKKDLKVKRNLFFPLLSHVSN